MPRGFELLEGTPGIGEDQVTHLMIPGRFRSEDGMGLSEFTTQRVVTAAAFYTARLLDLEGVIVCSGYKSPREETGEPWRDEHGREYQGVPEAHSMKAQLVNDHGIAPAAIQVERESVDTVTNFTYSQRFFPEGPVGIVAQEQHLERILKYVAPRTMRREYVGIIVPELPDKVDVDSPIGTFVSRYVARGLTPDNPHNAELAAARINRVWSILLVAHRIKQRTVRPAATKPVV